jgi:hypothetical protein
MFVNDIEDISKQKCMCTFDTCVCYNHATLNCRQILIHVYIFVLPHESKTFGMKINFKEFKYMCHTKHNLAKKLICFLNKV